MGKLPDKINSSLRKRFKKYGIYEIDNSVTLKAVYEKHRGICQKCGIQTKAIHPPQNNSASMEHLLPLSKGGSHTWDNVVLQCHKCNTTQGHNPSGLKMNSKHLFTFKIFGLTIKVRKDVKDEEVQSMGNT